MKRILDLTVSACALLLLAPLLALAALWIFSEDRHSPWFRGMRVGRAGVPFRMLKFRSMRVDAWKTGVNSTSAGDSRITRPGRWLRRTKLDELPQFFNVLLGHMSLVGPRPQVAADASLYTAEERRMLTIRPGITDLASIVFSDEGEILQGSADPDLMYNQIIRPWKSRLALLYLDHQSLLVDGKIIWLSGLCLVSRPRALAGVQDLLRDWGAGERLRSMAQRNTPLVAYPPPGAEAVVDKYVDKSVDQYIQAHSGGA